MKPGNPACPACKEQRLHTPEEWKHHPLRGHGYLDNVGWTHPDLAREAIETLRRGRGEVVNA